MIDSFCDWLIYRLAIARYPGASFERKRQHAAAQVQQNFLVLIN